MTHLSNIALLIDSDDDTREMIAAGLEGVGFDVTEQVNYEDVLTYLHTTQTQYDVIVLESFLPSEDSADLAPRGHTLADVLRKLQPGSVIVLYSVINPRAVLESTTDSADLVLDTTNHSSLYDIALETVKVHRRIIQSESKTLNAIVTALSRLRGGADLNLIQDVL